MNNSIEPLGVSILKACPAAAGTTVSFTEAAQHELLPFLDLPWSTVAAILTCIYTSCILYDWIKNKWRNRK